jgi:hypothetical protein
MEELRFNVFESRVLKRIFGPKREEVLEGWRRLYNETLYNLYTSSDINKMIKSRKVRRMGHVAHMGEMRNTYRLVTGKPEGRTPLGRQESNVRMDLRETVWEGVDWMHLVQDTDQWQALMNMVMASWVP